jgi:hypothetical protein
MRKDLGIVETLKQLVVSGDVQEGLIRLALLPDNMLDWSAEQTVINFTPRIFTREHAEAARYRLALVKRKARRRGAA